ncbi:LAMI_0E13740g1_1 [Lachancea mirantina]|uniref:LAMI_0E13740g1_1 n=1 Tax=Lachancea mirantina TaxID=1230905 RepID=A0A1G4JR16_9SACH|nr:LAMI_0E13740g1_1 [Lachancea mirantina]
MGQGVSSETQTQAKNATFGSETDLLSYYDKLALKLITAPEFVSFKSNANVSEIYDEVSCEMLMKLLSVGSENSVLVECLFNLMRVLSNFPLIKDSYAPLTYVGILKCCLLLDKERCPKFVGRKNFDQARLLFVALALNKSVKELSSSPASTTPLDSNCIVENLNGVDLEDLYVPSDMMLEFLTFLLRISPYCLTKNSKLPKDLYDNWPEFKTYALNILRTMSPNIAGMADLSGKVITCQQFTGAVKTFFPQLLDPLGTFVQHVLFLNRDLVVTVEKLTTSLQKSKLVNDALLSQMATIWQRQLLFSTLQKLYVGRESGFSMRSFQSKVFKWMAPSILLVSGMRVADDVEFARSNQRYRKFLEEYPRLKDLDQHLDTASRGKRKVLFAVYVDEPWRVTNKALFGNLKTAILQLGPKQNLFQATRDENIYFNTVGGGIGIGNSQPALHGPSKRFRPGNVSLTVDSNLEFGAFRNVGYGGSIVPNNEIYAASDHHASYEYRFLIQDVEVWGCGGEKELEEQLKNWEWEEAEAKRRQRINLKNLNEERAILEMAGIIGQAQSGGSM